MSIKVMTWVWDHAPVSGTDLLLLLAIADQADDDGRNSYPSVKRLAQRTRLDERTVQRVVRRLTNSGNLLVHNGGGRRNNRYSIVMSSADPEFSTPLAERHPRRDATGGPLPPEDRPSAGGGVAELRHPSSGTAVPPEPSLNHPEPHHPHAGTRAGELRLVSTPDGGGGVDPDAVLAGLGGKWTLTPKQRQRLAPKVAAALADGWPAGRLTEHLAANPEGVKSPAAVLAARLDDLPAPGTTGEIAAQRAKWCGACEEPTRLRERPDGRYERCPDCHPLRAGSNETGENPARHRSRQALMPRRANPQGDATPREPNREEQDQCPPSPNRDAS